MAARFDASKHFYGDACPFGHTLRYLKNRHCVACAVNGNRKYRATPQGKRLAKVSNLKWFKNNQTRVQAWRRDYAKKSGRKRLGLPEPTRPEPCFCELCGTKVELGKSLRLDHDHETGKFRGWLCNSCNLGLGKLGDNIAGLNKAIDYLEKAER